MSDKYSFKAAPPNIGSEGLAKWCFTKPHRKCISKEYLPRKIVYTELFFERHREDSTS